MLLGPFYGATGGPVSLDTPLAPDLLGDGRPDLHGPVLNTELNTSLNLGTTSTAWGFTMTVTPTRRQAAATAAAAAALTT